MNPTELRGSRTGVFYMAHLEARHLSVTFLERSIKYLVREANEAGFTRTYNKNLQQYLLICKAIANYVPGENYGGDVVLIQATTKSNFSTVMPKEDYNNVSLHCKGAVSRFEMKGDHETFLDEEHVQETAEILNQLLNKHTISRDSSQ